MANILDYIDWRGDLNLRDASFNEVDGLIMAELAYLDLGEILSEDPRPQMSLTEVCEHYLALGIDQSHGVNDPGPLLRKAAKCRRFGSLMLGGYINHIDPERELQLAALSIYWEDGSVCAAFRGTDDSIVGWREDFNFSFQDHTAGQTEAVAYLKRLGETFDGPIRVCGHSKGGNFAVYAAAFCGSELRERRILRIYANDAPGFRKELAKTLQIQSILGKTAVVIPESSLIGILLSTKKEKKIIRSSASGLEQHNPYTWQVLGPCFEAADSRSASSLFMDETLHRWLDELDDQQRADFVRAVFDAMESSGALTLHELKAEPVATANAILSAIRNMDPELQRSAFASLRKLAAAGGGTLRDEILSALVRHGIEILPGSREKTES